MLLHELVDTLLLSLGASLLLRQKLLVSQPLLLGLLLGSCIRCGSWSSGVRRNYPRSMMMMDAARRGSRLSRGCWSCLRRGRMTRRQSYDHRCNCNSHAYAHNLPPNQLVLPTKLDVNRLRFAKVNLGESQRHG